ncbi:MAG: type IV conjugative transfer system coupling protein TraD [Candidatus Berkiella sp.]
MFNDQSSFQKIIRGGQVTLHIFTMYGQILKVMLACVVFLIVAFNVGWYMTKNTPVHREVFTEYMSAAFRAKVNPLATQTLKDTKGRSYFVRSRDFITSTEIQRVVGEVYISLIQGAVISLALGILLLITGSIWLRRMGARATETKVLNNHQLDEPKNVNKLLQRRKQQSDLRIADLHLVKDSETKHILALGTTGSGKSNLIKSLIQQIIERGDRFIVFDKSCDLANQFYHPDSAVILNPFDERTPCWNVWSDCRDSADFRSLAESLLPMPVGSGSDPFWISAARVLFSATAYQMRNEPDKSIVGLLKKLLTTSLEDMQRYLAHTDAASLVSKEIEKTAVSIKTQLATYLSCLKYLKDEGDDFSIRKWIQDESKTQGIFITSLADKHHVLMPLISMWLDLSLNAMMSLAPDQQRRVWIILDEAQSLNNLPCLFAGVNEARKFGGCIVLASTSRFALTDLYGAERSRSILGQFNTSVFFRTPDYDGSLWVSKELGESEVEEVHENYSYGANSMRDGVSLNRQRIRRPVVPYTDIQKLPDHQAYIKLPGTYPISRVVFPFQNPNRLKEPGFILRAVNEDVFKEINQLEDVYLNHPQDAHELQTKQKEKNQSKQKAVKQLESLEDIGRV